MSEYTPDTDSVRACYLSTHTAASGERVRDEAARSFDRWLDQERAAARRGGQAEAWDEAVASAYLHEDKYRISIEHDPNPYRGGAGQ